jgi:hypothetical protein
MIIKSYNQGNRLEVTEEIKLVIQSVLLYGYHQRKGQLKWQSL